MEETRELLLRTAELAADFLESLEERPVFPAVEADQLRRLLGGPLPEQRSDPAEVLEQLVAGAEPGVVAMPSGRYFGFVIGGAVPAALAADWLTSTWDQNAGLYVGGPSASVVEEIAGGWLKQLLGIPAHASRCVAAAIRSTASMMSRGGSYGSTLSPRSTASAGRRRSQLAAIRRLANVGGAEIEAFLVAEVHADSVEVTLLESFDAHDAAMRGRWYSCNGRVPSTVSASDGSSDASTSERNVSNAGSRAAAADIRLMMSGKRNPSAASGNSDG